MRTYELVLVYEPALEVEQVDTDLRRLNDVVANGGLSRKWERWGKRRLAFEIKGRQYGYYVLTVFDAEPAVMAELERTVRINPLVIRHLITVVDPKRVPEVDLESVRTLGAAPEPVAAPADMILAEAADVVSDESEIPASAPEATEVEGTEA